MVRVPEVTCPRCARIFAAASGCVDRGCPERSGCSLLKCPSCGEEFRPVAPFVARVGRWLDRLLRRR